MFARRERPLHRRPLLRLHLRCLSLPDDKDNNEELKSSESLSDEEVESDEESSEVEVEEEDPEELVEPFLFLKCFNAKPM